MAIVLYNLREVRPRHPWDVKVDRSSPLGNPFKDGTRDEQCDRYESWFRTQILNRNPEIIAELDRLSRLYIEHGKLGLFCWCVPKRCHSQTIQRGIFKYIRGTFYV